MTDEPAHVTELQPDEKLPWSARRLLRRARRDGAAGVLLHAAIHEPVRGVSSRSSVVSVREGGKRLCMCSKTSKFPKFAALPPGTHELEFAVTRTRGGTSVTRTATLRAGEVLVALCEPVQPDTVYRRGPSVDGWRIGRAG